MSRISKTYTQSDNAYNTTNFYGWGRIDEDNIEYVIVIRRNILEFLDGITPTKFPLAESEISQILDFLSSGAKINIEELSYVYNIEGMISKEIISELILAYDLRFQIRASV